LDVEQEETTIDGRKVKVWHQSTRFHDKDDGCSCQGNSYLIRWMIYPEHLQAWRKGIDGPNWGPGERHGRRLPPWNQGRRNARGKLNKDEAKKS
jgi:hypothetical protein